jgi:MFS family permease
MRLYLLGDTLSNFGDFALFLAVAIWVKMLTGSTAAAGLVMFAFAAGSVLLPLSGLLVDRVARRPLLVAANLLLTAAVLLLLVVRDAGQIWLIYVVMFAYGALGSVTGPAQQALLPTLVPEELLGDANGLLQAVRGLLRTFSPVIGAGLFAWLGAGAVVVIDAATFVVAAVTLLAIRVQEPTPTRVRQHWFTEISAGLRFIGRTARLRQLILTCALAMLVLGFFESIGLAIVSQGLGHAPTFLGVLGAGQAVGTVAGGITAGAVLRRVGEGRTVILGLGLVAASSLLMVTTVDAVVVGAMVVLGACVPWIIVGATTALQRHTPTDVQGRVFAAFEFGVTVPQTVSIALGAGLIATVDYRALLAAVVVVALIAATYLAAHPAQRALPVATHSVGADAGASPMQPEPATSTPEPESRREPLAAR